MHGVSRASNLNHVLCRLVEGPDRERSLRVYDFLVPISGLEPWAPQNGYFCEYGYLSGHVWVVI